jgi:hypothetical protein
VTITGQCAWSKVWEQLETGSRFKTAHETVSIPNKCNLSLLIWIVGMSDPGTDD